MPAVIAALLIATACGSTSAARVFPSTSQSASPTRVASPTPTFAPSPTPTPAAGDLPVTPVDFSCRLPVTGETFSADSASFQGAFVTLPAAAWADDPTGLISWSSPSPVYVTAQTPVLKAVWQTGPASYDQPLHRWLPVAEAQTSPDGTAYAYGTTTAIYKVTVADGTNKSIALTAPDNLGGKMVVEQFDGRYAYFIVATMSTNGVWKVDLTNGSVSALTQVMNIFAVRDGVAWIGYLDPHDTTPPQLPQGGEGSVFDSIVAVDLRTGARTTWFYRPGQSVSLLAIDDSGRPIVSAKSGPDYFSPGGEIRRLSEPLSGGEGGGDFVYGGGLSFDSVRPDGDRIWLGSDRGIYLYTAAGLQKVFAVTPKHGVSLLPAGRCI